MATRLDLRDTVDLPVREASGIAVRTVDDARWLIAIGDRHPTVAIAPLDDAGTIGEWTIVDLAERFGWPDREGGSQFEAVTTDGTGLVAVMREDPSVVHLIDLEPLALRASIELVVDRDHPLADRWADPSSRGEGLVLLRDGRLLVAKEKGRPALVEFVPPRGAPASIGRDDLLRPGDAWPCPDVDVAYRAHGVWSLRRRMRKRFKDLSALAVTPDHGVLLLSDQGRRIGRLDLLQPLPLGGGRIREPADSWRLPAGAEKPEGLAVVDDATWLVALDTRHTTGNGLVLAAP